MLDRAAIGRVLPPVTATVERGRLRFFLNAIGETSPIHHDTAAAQAAIGWASFGIALKKRLKSSWTMVW